MSETTTIEIRQDQADELQARKEHERESYKSVLDRVLDADAERGDANLTVSELADEVTSEVDTVDSDKIAREVAATIDYATLAKKVADEVEGRMR